MLLKTNGIVLRSIKYGETSLITTLFTATLGIQTYMVQGVRSSRPQANRAGLFQPGMLLELVVYQQAQKNMQRIREFRVAHIYGSLQEDVIKNSIVLFSAELLLRLLPEHAPLPSLFDITYEYFVTLDKLPLSSVANFPLYFIMQCSSELGYELKGNYSPDSPHLNMQEGGYTEHAPAAAPFMSDEDARALSTMQQITTYEALKEVGMSSDMRLRLLDWYIAFLQQHTQHMGNIRSLAVLRTILH